MRSFTDIAALTVLMAGCGHPLAPADTVTGTYSLQSIDGEPVPFLLSTSPSVEILGRTFVLDDNGHFTDQTDLRVQLDGTMQLLPSQKTGAYFLDGSEITLVYSSGRRLSSTVKDDAIRLADRGLVFTLER